MRMPIEFEPNAFTNVLEQKKREGEKLFDLTISNPTQVGLNLPDSADFSIPGSKLKLYEPNPRGLLRTREIISSMYAADGANPEDFWLTSSTSEAYSVLFKLLTEPGESILIPKPSYPLFEHLAALELTKTETYDLKFDEGRWKLDIDAIEDAIHSGVRAIVIVHPNNPTGNLYSQTEQRAIIECSEAYQLPIISDEVFLAYAPKPAQISFGRFQSSQSIFILNGLSKGWGLPQCKLSWVWHKTQNAKQRHIVAERLDWIQDQYLSVSTWVQVMLPKLQMEGEILREKIQARIDENRNALNQWLASRKEISIVSESIGWSAILNFEDTVDEEQFVLELLNNRNVVVHPGYFFDLPFSSSIVLSLLPEPRDFLEALRRLDP